MCTNIPFHPVDNVHKSSFHFHSNIMDVDNLVYNIFHSIYYYFYMTDPFALVAKFISNDYNKYTIICHNFRL